MTNVTSTQSLIADAHRTYDRDQQQQASITGKKPTPEPSDQELIATDPLLAAAIEAAKAAAAAVAAKSSGVDGAHNKDSDANGPATKSAATPATAPAPAAAPSLVKIANVTA